MFRFFDSLWRSDPVLENGMAALVVILLVASSVLLLYFRSRGLLRRRNKL